MRNYSEYLKSAKHMSRGSLEEAFARLSRNEDYYREIFNNYKHEEVDRLYKKLLWWDVTSNIINDCKGSLNECKNILRLIEKKNIQEIDYGNPIIHKCKEEKINSMLTAVIMNFIFIIFFTIMLVKYEVIISFWHYFFSCLTPFAVVLGLKMLFNDFEGEQ